ncbi:hypothetical protein GTY75_05205 [Streptomyces sp. SID8381]|uniref:hypothetical protein n=1 Tax=unclassified Streptomyces TaxID=2593676 RepID=UPI00036C444F|nr:MULTISPECIES: hypothetical protein [unclassified Streptomyces]MYX26071.1 hypothetical protein [Streptomyces sp. SID8381]
MVTTITCDGCKKKGLDDVTATVELKIADDEYDLCDEHGGKFKAMFAQLFGTDEAMAQSA